MIFDPKKNSQSMSGEGGISWRVYKLYIDSAGGPLAAFLVALAFALSIGSTAFSSWWLKHWFSRNEAATSHNGNTNGTHLEVIDENSPDFALNRNIYAGIILIIFATSIFRTILFVIVSCITCYVRFMVKINILMVTGHDSSLTRSPLPIAHAILPKSAQIL